MVRADGPAPCAPPGHPAAACVPHPVSSPHACAPVSRDMLAVPSFVPVSATTPSRVAALQELLNQYSSHRVGSLFFLFRLSSRWKQPLLLAGRRPPGRCPPLAWGAAGNALARRVPGRAGGAGRPQARAPAGVGW